MTRMVTPTASAFPAVTVAASRRQPSGCVSPIPAEPSAPGALAFDFLRGGCRHHAPNQRFDAARDRPLEVMDPTSEAAACVRCVERGCRVERQTDFDTYAAARRAHLYRTACLLCGDPHRAEDIVQDALARLYANWSRVSRADNVEGYVRRILVNSHYSNRRRPWRRESASTSIDLPPLAPGTAVEDAEVLWSAIRALPPGQRKVIVLRHIWDRSVEQTAADLGITPGTVKSQTRDALDSLRRALQSDFGSASLLGEER